MVWKIPGKKLSQLHSGYTRQVTPGICFLSSNEGQTCPLVVCAPGVKAQDGTAGRDFGGSLVHHTLLRLAGEAEAKREVICPLPTVS